MKVPDLVASTLPEWTPIDPITDGIHTEVLQFNRWRAIVSSDDSGAVATVHERAAGEADSSLVASLEGQSLAQAKEAAEQEIVRRWVGKAPAWREGEGGECSVAIGPVQVLVGPDGQGDWLVEVLDSTGAASQSATYPSREAAKWMGLDMASGVLLRWSAHLEMLLEADAPPVEQRS